MKPMSDRKMKMSSGKPKSDSFFPSESEVRVLPKASEIKGFDYPDTDEDIHRDQQESISKSSKNQPKPNFRH